MSLPLVGELALLLRLVRAHLRAPVLLGLTLALRELFLDDRTLPRLGRVGLERRPRERRDVDLGEPRALERIGVPETLRVRLQLRQPLELRRQLSFFRLGRREPLLRVDRVALGLPRERALTRRRGLGRRFGRRLGRFGFGRLGLERCRFGRRFGRRGHCLVTHCITSGAGGASGGGTGGPDASPCRATV